MADMLNYKNYTGIVEHDPHGRIFTGEVIGLRDTITFQGRTPDELEHSFRESIDFYLEMCARDGIQPSRPFSGRFNVRLNPETHRKIAENAARERKSLNQWVVEAIEKALYH
ncbi:MAG TPA: type II toxin-antitoxin system HicB family antitoxin [Anaerolineales bacterium]|nr:type II toxin-antitoxin system HicB family antitoxin [Anaerolineales bacterium]